MIRFHKFVSFAVMVQVLPLTVSSENATDEIKSKDGRRSSGILIIHNSGQTLMDANGQRITSEKVATKTFVPRVTSGSSGSSGVRGWVSGSQTQHVVQPKMSRSMRIKKSFVYLAV